MNGLKCGQFIGQISPEDPSSHFRSRRAPLQTPTALFSRPCCGSLPCSRVRLSAPAPPSPPRFVPSCVWFDQKNCQTCGKIGDGCSADLSNDIGDYWAEFAAQSGEITHLCRSSARKLLTKKVKCVVQIWTVFRPHVGMNCRLTSRAILCILPQMFLRVRATQFPW
jgi:hypothetical protein